MWLLIPCFVLYLTNSVQTFNVDIHHPIVIQDPSGENGSYFGFAMSFRTNTTDKWIVIGAPRANSSLPEQRVLVEPGMVYQCYLDESFNVKCETLVYDKSGNSIGSFFHHKKDHGFYGATIVCDPKPDGLLVICSPRWKNQSFKNSYLMNGLCYTMSKDRNSTRIPLLRKNLQEAFDPFTNFTRYNFAFGQAGFSAAINKSEVYFGSPGIMDWTGSVTLQRPKQLMNINPLHTKHLSEFDYAGYSLAVGTFQNGEITLVIGAPRGNFLTGKVLIVKEFQTESDWNVIANISGRTTGEYFGASLVALDIDGDGVDELVVGAPNGNRAEVFSVDESGWHSRDQLNNGNKGGSFGIALASIGDIDGDGGMDLAIGAPYENDDKGVVYIYRSRGHGLQSMVTLSQIIQAPPGFLTWGWSFAPYAMDIDNNGVPDLAVGAYLSGHVAILRSRPVAFISARLQGGPTMIVPDTTKEFTIQACFSLKKGPDNLGIKSTLSIDNSMSNRALFRENNETSYTWNTTLPVKETTHCHNLHIILINGSNPTRPLEFQLMNQLKHQPLPMDPFCAECPILDPSLKTNASAILRIPYANGCADVVCYPDLKILLLENDHQITLGASKSFSIRINVSSNAEPAFQSKLLIKIPDNTRLLYIPVNCEETSESPVMMECEIGNPLSQEQIQSVQLSLDTTKLPTNQDQFIIKVEAKSYGNETSPEDNVREIPVKVLRKSQLEISSSVFPSQVNIVRNETEPSNESIRVMHSFHFSNLGPTPADEAVIDLRIPVEITNELQSESIPFVQFFHVNSTEDINCYSKNLEKADVSLQLPSWVDSNRTVELACTEKSSFISKCENFRCIISKSAIKNFSAHIDVILLVNLTKLEDLTKNYEYGIIRTIATSQILRPLMHEQVDYNNIADTIFYRFKSQSKLLYIILAIIGGLIILALIILLLYLMGFFKRSRKEDLETLKENEEKKEPDNITSNSRDSTITTDTTDIEANGTEEVHSS